MPLDGAAVRAVDAAVEGALRDRRILRAWIACSGGADSLALLLAVERVAARLRQLGAPLPARRVLHVDHGLAEASPRWAAAVSAAALRCGIGCLVVRTTPTAATETAARTARYREFARVLGAGDVLLLAHHRDDDAETVLLDALRGSGVRAMPRTRALGAGFVLRPLLGLPRKVVRASFDDTQHEPVADPANDALQHRRNRVRHVVLPAIAEGFDYSDERLLSLARGYADRDVALQLLLAPVLQGASRADGGLELAALRRAPLPLARVLLAAWLRPRCGDLPHGQLAELLRQSLTAQDDARGGVSVGAYALWRYGDALYLVRRSAAPGARSWGWSGALPLDCAVGRLRRLPAIAALRWPDTDVAVRLRRGGERLRLHDGGPSRTVKSLLREARVPVWQRAYWPLVYAGDTLIAVPAVCVAAGWRTAAREAGYTLVFEPASV